MSGPKPAAVLFDLGGTLVSTPNLSLVSAGLKGAQNAYARLKEAGADLPSSLLFYQRVMVALGGAAAGAGRGKEELRLGEEIQKFFTGMGRPLSDEHLRVALRAWYAPFSEKAVVLPGAEAALGRLRDLGLAVAVVSNSVWPDWLLREDVERLGLAGLVGPIVVSSTVGVRKPDPRMFEAGLKAVGTEASRAVFVGNSLQEDVGGARFVGMRTIYLNESGQPDDAGLADAEVRDLAGVCPVIETWLGGD